MAKKDETPRANIRTLACQKDKVFSLCLSGHGDIRIDLTTGQIASVSIPVQDWLQVNT